MTKNQYTRLAIALGTTLLVSSCEQAENIEEVPLRSVKHVVVAEPSAERIRTFSGVSKSELEAKLSFKVAGNITSLYVAVGDTIESGQLIAELDPSTYQLQEQQAQADLTRATAELRNADSAYQRTRELYENQNASKNDLDTTRAGFESAKAQVSAATRAVDIARLNVSYTRLLARESCSVASTSADAGENVSAGQEVIRVNCGDQIKVEVSVPENLISEVEPDLPATIVFDSIPGQEFNGNVTEIGVAATGTTFPVSVHVADGVGLRAGLAAQVRFSFESNKVWPVVPVTAVAEDQQGRFVYVLQPGQEEGTGLISRQDVEIGSLVSTGIEVTSGVKPGDRVVTAGVSVIRDGLVVKFN